MKILYCIPSAGGGGAERQLTYLAKALVQCGCEIHVALGRGGQNLGALEAAGATIHPLEPVANHDPRILSRLMSTIATTKPDIVQCWLLQMQLLGGLACMVSGTPWLFSERSSEKAYPPTLKNFLRVRIASFADGIVSNSAAGDEYWRARAKQRVQRYVIPNGLPLDEIAAVPPATAEEVEARPDEAVVLYAGRLNAGKNAETLVHALGRVTSKTPFRALLCGDGPMRGHLERLVVEIGLAPRVRIVPYASNLWGLMKRASVLVSPSRFEGSPNVVLEAMACGCPLVVSDIPAHRELLDEQSALFVGPDDADAMARRIEAVIADREAARRRAEMARARTDRYALPVIARQYLDVYRDVVARRAGASNLVAP